jgi:hypothetical protein
MSLTAWRKSTFSESSQTACVEVAWRKSSHSSAAQGNCVEVACDASGVALRDSKNTTGPVLTVDLDGWRALTATLSHR